MAEKQTVTLEGDFIPLCRYIMDVVSKKSSYVKCGLSKSDKLAKVLVIELGIKDVKYKWHRAEATLDKSGERIEIDGVGDRVLIAIGDTEFVVKRNVTVDDIGGVMIIDIVLNDNDTVGCL